MCVSFAEDGAAPAEGVPAGVPRLTSAALVLDTLGQNRSFDAASIDTASAWATRLAEAFGRHEVDSYSARYKAAQDAKAAAAAAAAAAAQEAAPAGDTKGMIQ